LVLGKAGNIVAVSAGAIVAGYSMQHQDPWLVGLGLGALLVGAMTPQRLRVVGILEYISGQRRNQPKSQPKASQDSTQGQDLTSWQLANQNQVLRFVTILTGNQAEAQTITAGAFSALLSGHKQMPDAERLKRTLRLASKLVEGSLSSVRPAHDPLPATARSALDSLPFWLRAGVLLKTILGLDDAEIAWVLERTVAEVRKRLPAARDLVTGAVEEAKKAK
jgi:hypothetical protein